MMAERIFLNAAETAMRCRTLIELNCNYNNCQATSIKPYQGLMKFQLNNHYSFPSNHSYSLKSV